MTIRIGSAVWEGRLENGKGSVRVGDGAFEGAYSFASRFEAGQGTNPEELIAAAHAGCFSMALAHSLELAGYTPERIETTAQVHLRKNLDGFQITPIHLKTSGHVPGIDPAAFQEMAAAAKQECPVSRLFSGVETTLEATLE